MHLIEILLPLYDRAGAPIDAARFAEVRRELVAGFGGLTAFTRAPAQGAWRNPAGEVERDDVVIVEVQAETLEREWWRGYRRALETRFAQAEISVRAFACEKL